MVSRHLVFYGQFLRIPLELCSPAVLGDTSLVNLGLLPWAMLHCTSMPYEVNSARFWQTTYVQPQRHP